MTRQRVMGGSSAAWQVTGLERVFRELLAAEHEVTGAESRDRRASGSDWSF